MKKILSFLTALIVLLALGSCADNAVTEEPQAPNELNETNLKIKRAVGLANAEMERYFPAKSRARARRPAMDAIGTIREATSRSGEDTLIYVVNYADNGGYALVSARDNVDPVLAVVPEGNYNPEVGSNNPGFNIFLEAAKEHVKAAREVEITPVPDDPLYIIVDGEFQKTESSVITHWSSNGARLGETFHWEQGKLYGKYCINTLTGSSPLAMAGIITFLRYQEHFTDRIEYSYPNKDRLYDDFEWIQIMKHKRTDGVYSSSGEHYSAVCWEHDKEETHKKIARLCRQLGYDANASYNNNFTSVAPSKPVYVLTKHMPEFKVSSLTDFTSFTTMRYIDHGLLYMRGEKVGSNAQDHAWICDGYDYKKISYTTYRSPVPEPLTNPIEYHWRVYSTSVTETSKNHIIWGWAGQDDGWYSGDVFIAKDKSESFTNFQYISVTIGI